MQRPGDPAGPPVDRWPAPPVPEPFPARAGGSPAGSGGHPGPGEYNGSGGMPGAGEYTAGGASGAAGYPPPTTPYGLPADLSGPYPPRPRLWPPTRPEWATAVATVAALAAAGAVLAVLWVQLAPRLAFRVDQPGRAVPVIPEAEEYIAADARFVLLTLAAGAVAGLACWLVRASRGPLLLLALAAGSLLGAVVTWRLGMRLASGYRPEDLQGVGRTVYPPLTLQARAALVVEPVAAVLVYLLAVGFSSRTDLGRDDDPVSSGSA